MAHHTWRPPGVPGSSPQASVLTTAMWSPVFEVHSQSPPRPKMWSSRSPLLSLLACDFLLVFQNITWTSNFLGLFLCSLTPTFLCFIVAIEIGIGIFDLFPLFPPIVFELLKRRDCVYSLTSRVSGIRVHALWVDEWVRLKADSRWS